ncbi:hypothetical protein BS17DRAFT_819974 [Gyrodon lividus]|nr:hypothetical protein BS17DRAFT_819974 [Gyrodon lividus]
MVARDRTHDGGAEGLIARLCKYDLLSWGGIRLLDITSYGHEPANISITYAFVDPITQRVYHIERRPAERGRSVIGDTCSSTNLPKPDSPWNARSTVHEYGGGAAAAYDGIIYPSNAGDGRLYKPSVTEEGVSEEPSAVTPPGLSGAAKDSYRYASPTPHPIQQHLLVAVLEDHTNDTPSTVITILVCINTLASIVHPSQTSMRLLASSGRHRIVSQEWKHPHHMCLIQDTDHTRIAMSMHAQPSHPGSGVSYDSWLTDDSLLFLVEASVLKEWITEDVVSLYKLLGSSYYAPLDFSGSDSSQGEAPLDSKVDVLFVAFCGGRTVLYVADTSNIGKVEGVELDCPFVDLPELTHRATSDLATYFSSPSHDTSSPSFVGPVGEKPPSEVDAARILSSLEHSLTDPLRCVIRGVSAGGHTVLSSAAGTYVSSSSPPELGFAFKAGASLYGVGDLQAPARESHKFKSHYLRGLMGGRPDELRMEEILQGVADRVVPPEQSQGIVEAIETKGRSERIRYVNYEGGGHDFARADSKQSALEEEARWLGNELKLWHLDSADCIYEQGYDQENRMRSRGRNIDIAVQVSLS